MKKPFLAGIFAILYSTFAQAASLEIYSFSRGIIIHDYTRLSA
jgi:hypothetical protein